MFLLDIAPPVGGATGIGIFLAVAFFFVVLASGVFAFVMLRKTIKMAFRMVIVGAVLLIAVFGSLALWLFLQPSRPANRPARPTTQQTPINQKR